VTQGNGGRRYSSGRDALWFLVAFVAFGWTVFVIVDSISDGFSGGWPSWGVGGAIWLAVGYWVAVGAWRRTRSGRARLGRESFDPGDEGAGGFPG
jgi:hypothetical protein